ncbi:site-specific DNA-methyltransferase [Sporanaerobacter acetigenes]|uniref:site-specific DNA-methyltransferase n=1 Tax=Sporanaerobacter acetigenes TaxID=165813 RepID=UPI00331AFF49
MIREKIKYNDTVKSNSREIMKLKKEFPGYFDKDGNFLIDRFTSMLSQEDVDIEREGYELQFLGKSYAKYITSTETTTVLTPDIEHNEKHENKDSENLYIVGDNLDVIKHLLNSYSGKIKCIYIDPPYNTGSDGFVYPDNFKFTKESLSNIIGIEEDEAERILNMAGKSTHSAWMTFMYPRLMLSRDLLSDDGVIFISIDDNEYANLKLICDEIFGEDNFIATIPWRKRTAKSDVPFGTSQDYDLILMVAKSEQTIAHVEGTPRRYYETDDLPGRPWRIHDMKTQRTASERPNSNFTMINPKNGEEFPVDPNAVWRITEKDFDKYYKDNRIVFPGDYDFLRITNPNMRYFKEDDMLKDGELFGRVAFSTNLPSDVGMSKEGTATIQELFGYKAFDNPKPHQLISWLIEAGSDDGDIILDFFSGSATTAHSVMELNANNYNEKGRGNRKYIMVQLPEIIKKNKPAYEAGYRTIDEIGRARIGKTATKIKEETGADIDYGYKLYRLNEPSDKTLDKIVEFDPYETLILDDMTKSFEFGNVPGRDTILATWINMDGYGLVSQTGKIHLHQYEADIIEDSLYIIDPGLATEDVMELIKKIEDGSLNISRIVLYPYSVVFNVVHELRKNIVNLRNNRNINVIERY